MASKSEYNNYKQRYTGAGVGIGPGNVAVRPIVKGTPWAVIVLVYFLFFPAGIVLMISKLHKEKYNYTSNGKATAGVGWFFVGLGVFYVIIGLSAGLETDGGGSVLGGLIFMFLLCAGGGYALVRHGNKYKTLGRLQDRYDSLIVNSTDGSIDDFAKALGSTYEAVCSDLQKLLNSGSLPDSYIDVAGRCLVSPLLKRTRRSEEAAPGYNRPSAEPERQARVKTVKCPNCGGINTVTEGANNVCDFCGSPLE